MKVEIAKLRLKPVQSPKGVFDWIDKDRLEVDHIYQRSNLKTENIRQIAENFDWAKFGVVSVARRPDGSLFVMDAQHRVLAARLRSDILQLPCMIHDISAVADEAKTFLGINKDRKSSGRLDLHKTSLAAGDPLAVKLDALIRRNGLVLSTGRQKNSIECIAELERCAKADFSKLESIFPVVVNLYGERTIEHEVLNGFFNLVIRPGGDRILETKYRAKIVATGPDEFRETIKQKKVVAGKRAEVTAAAVLEVINKGLHKKNKLDISLI